MTGPTHWPGIAVWILVGAVVMLVLPALLERAARAYRHRGRVGYTRRRFACPETGTDVECVLTRSMRTGAFRDVVACSAFADPERVTCDKACVRLLSRGIPLRPPQHGANSDGSPRRALPLRRMS